MKISHRILVIGITLALMAAVVPSAWALPPLPSSFYGTVKANSANVPVGTPVTALINGVPYAATTVTLYLSDTVYSLDVPGDDPTTPGVIEGGREGDTIVFRIGLNTIADQTGVWHGGTNAMLNLSANPTAVRIQKFSAGVDTASSNLLMSLLAAVALGLCGVGLIWLGRRKS